MYHPVLVVPPAIKPLTLARAKQHLRVDFDDENATIEALIAAATAYLDGWTGILRRCLCQQQWRSDADAFRTCMRLPLFPAIGIVSVVYRDVAGVEQPVDASNYSLRVDDRGAYVQFVSGFSAPPLSLEGAAVSVTAKYGYADIAGEGDAPATSSVPEDLKAAMLMLLSHWYEHRDAVVMDGAPVALPMAVEAILATYRRLTV